MQRVTRFRIPLIALALVAAAPVQASPDSLLALQNYDRQLLGIGYRLAMSGGDLCTVRTAQPGFVLHDLTQYPRADQADARAVFGFAGDPLVLAIAPDSPAAKAGLREGDALLAVDGRPVPVAKPNARNSYARMETLLTRLDAAAADGMLDLRVRRGAEQLALKIPTPSGCASRFQTHASAAIDSRADGIYVELNTGVIDFAANEAQVAAIVAHELAHNILRHRARLDAAGIRRGMLGQFGRNARLIRQTEIEADRLAVYLMDRAGYPADAIIAFWERYDRTHPLGFLNAPTHPKPKARIEIVREETARIAEMKAAGKSPRPAFMESETLPELR